MGRTACGLDTQSDQLLNQQPLAWLAPQVARPGILVLGWFEGATAAGTAHPADCRFPTSSAQ
jgi:hypothetical protein